MGEREGAYRVLVVIPEGRYHFEYLDVDERIILKWSFNKWDGVLDWIDLPQDRDRWRAFVSAAMNLRLP
jgi:hypothetical protein